MQTIRFSAVGAKWQSGLAENAIIIVTNKARTMMIHAALHWPEIDDKAMWPMAMTYAVHLYNHTPNMKTKIAPVEVFSQSLTVKDTLIHAHPWGCPAYVLEPTLTESGGKIPKWQPMSRRAQFVGCQPSIQKMLAWLGIW